MKINTSACRIHNATLLALGGLLTTLLWLLAFTLPAAELTFNRRASWPGYLMGGVKDVHATGPTVWLGLDCNGNIGALEALDLTNPAAPRVLSSTATGVGALWAFEDTLAYAVDRSIDSGYLEVYELADPSKPVLRSRTSIAAGWKVGLTIYQGYLWVFTESGLTTYDVRNPAVPSYAGSLTWSGQLMPSQMVICNGFGVFVTKTYTNPAEYWLHVIDLTNPAQPVETGSMPVSMGYVNWGAGVPILAALDDYIYYVTETDPTGVCHLEASRVTTSGTLEPAGVDLPLAGKQTGPLWPVGNFLYFAEYNSGTTAPLRVLDVAQRLQPVELASSGISLTTLQGIAAAKDGHVFLALNSSPDSLRMLGATNPAQPIDLGTVWRSWDLYGLVGGSDEPIWYAGENGTSRFRLFKAADLLQGNLAPYRDWNLPFVPGSYQTSGNYLTHVLVLSNYCYVLSWTYGTASVQLDVFNLSGTGSPVRTWSRQVIQNTSGPVSDGDRVRICGDKLYLAYYPGLLDIYSLSTPASPQFLSRTSIDPPRAVAIHNGYAYLWTFANDGNGPARLEVVDARDPSHPSAMTICGEYAGPWSGMMTVDGNLLYVVYRDQTRSLYPTVMDVFDLTNPLNPTRLSSTIVAQESEKYYIDDVAIQNRQALLVGAGLVAMDISDPVHPRRLGNYNPFPQLQNYTLSGFTQVKTWQNHAVIRNDTLGIEVIDVGVPLITRQPSSRTNAFGTPASFAVQAAGTLPLSYRWRRDGTNLVDGGKFSGVTTTNLLIANVQPADAGGYTVVVTNSFGSVTSLVAQLAVTIPPSPGRFSYFSYSPVMGFSFVFRDGTVGKPYRIQVSASLEGGWVDWMSFNYTAPRLFTDMEAVGSSNRFYRAVSP